MVHFSVVFSERTIGRHTGAAFASASQGEIANHQGILDRPETWRKSMVNPYKCGVTHDFMCSVGNGPRVSFCLFVLIYL